MAIKQLVVWWHGSLQELYKVGVFVATEVALDSRCSDVDKRLAN